MEEKIIYFTNDERNRLFQCLDEMDTKFIIRDRALIKVTYYCALRVSEISQLKLSDFNLENREITCRRIQGGKDNVIKIIDDDIYNSVAEYYKLRINDKYSSPYFFVSQKNGALTRSRLHCILYSYCEAAYIDNEKRHFQALRYTRVMDMIDMGCSIDEIIWWTGLTVAKTSTIYELCLQRMYAIQSDRSIREEQYKEMYKKLERGQNGSKKENSE